MTPIYLDNNATTRPDPRVVERVREVSDTCFGNPGSPHAVGRRARQVLEDARERVASLLNASPDGVVFTSGATEASNLALAGLARGSGTLAATAGEHPASEEMLRHLAASGWRRSTLTVDADGVLDRIVLSEDVRLATAILAHNETGVVQDLQDLAGQCERMRVPWHVDATQAVGKVEVDFKRLGCTTLSFAPHKFHGPRGVGCLLARPGVTLGPQLLGGHQEGGRRAGTEPVALIAGLVTALELAIEEMPKRRRHVAVLRDLFEAEILSAIPNAVVHAAKASRLPNTSCIGFPSCDGQAMLVALDLAGVCCSMGSACASGSPEPAPALLAMGVDEALANSSLRFSLSHETTAAEIERAANTVIEVAKRQQSDRV